MRNWQKEVKSFLFDSDAGFANASILLGKASSNSFSDYINGNISLEDCIQKTDYGVNVVTTGFDFKDWKIFQNNFTDSMAEEFLSLARKHDYVIIDIGAGYSEKLKTFYLSSDKILLVTIPEPTAIVNAYTLIKALSIIGVNAEMDIVLNMIKDKSEIKSVEEVLKKTVKNFLSKDIQNFFYVMYDDVVHESVRRQIPLVHYRENSKTVKNIVYIVDHILDENKENKNKMKNISFFERFKNMFNPGGKD